MDQKRFLFSSPPSKKIIKVEYTTILQLQQCSKHEDCCKCATTAKIGECVCGRSHRREKKPVEATDSPNLTSHLQSSHPLNIGLTSTTSLKDGQPVFAGWFPTTTNGPLVNWLFSVAQLSFVTKTLLKVPLVTFTPGPGSLKSNTVNGESRVL